jgi:hypothetical protein
MVCAFPGCDPRVSLYVNIQHKMSGCRKSFKKDQLDESIPTSSKGLYISPFNTKGAYTLIEGRNI